MFCSRLLVVHITSCCFRWPIFFPPWLVSFIVELPWFKLTSSPVLLPGTVSPMRRMILSILGGTKQVGSSVLVGVPNAQSDLLTHSCYLFVSLPVPYLHIGQLFLRQHHLLVSGAQHRTINK